MPEESFHDAIPAERYGKDLLTLADCEQRLQELDDELIEFSQRQEKARKAAVEAKKAWYRHKDICIMQDKGGRSNADVRDAKARTTIDRSKLTSKSGRDLYDHYKDTESYVESLDNQLKVILARQSGLQSIMRGLRTSGGY